VEGSPYIIPVAESPLYRHALTRLRATLERAPVVVISDPLLADNLEAVEEIADLARLVDKASPGDAMPQLKGSFPTMDGGELPFAYPWHIFQVCADLAADFEGGISRDAQIEPDVEISGNVRIERNVIVLSGSRLKGNIYIGEDSFIGNDVLIRGDTVLGARCVVGFAAEIKSSLVLADAKIGPMSAVPDSVIGEGAFLGGLTRISNTHPVGKNATFKLDNDLFDTGRQHLGGFVGAGTVLSGSVRVSPGRWIGSGSFVGPSVNVVRNIPAGVRVELEQSLRIGKAAT
jgi:acetyltransferase-like isoleucine patch superfamily enzyme